MTTIPTPSYGNLHFIVHKSHLTEDGSSVPLITRVRARNIYSLWKNATQIAKAHVQKKTAVKEIFRAVYYTYIACAQTKL